MAGFGDVVRGGVALDTARSNYLRMLAKSSSMREQVKRAALRVYLKRTGQRGV